MTGDADHTGGRDPVTAGGVLSVFVTRHPPSTPATTSRGGQGAGPEVVGDD